MAALAVAEVVGEDVEVKATVDVGTAVIAGATGDMDVTDGAAITADIGPKVNAVLVLAAAVDVEPKPPNAVLVEAELGHARLPVVEVGAGLERLPNIPNGATTGPNNDGRVAAEEVVALAKGLGVGVVVAAEPKTLPVLPSVDVVDAAGAAGLPEAAAVVTVAAVRVGPKLLWKGDGELGFEAACGNVRFAAA